MGGDPILACASGVPVALRGKFVLPCDKLSQKESKIMDILEVGYCVEVGYFNETKKVFNKKFEELTKEDVAGAKYICCFHDGLVHRDGGPAETWFYSDGTVKSVVYYTKGKVSRGRYDGPAMVSFDPKGREIEAQYLFGGKGTY